MPRPLPPLPSLTEDYGFRNYAPAYVELLRDRDETKELEEAAADLVGCLLEALRLLSLVAPAGRPPALEDPTLLRALHGYLFNVAHFIGLHCRTLLEAAPKFEDHEGYEEYAGHLQRKCALDAQDAGLLTLGWVEQDETLCQRVVDHELRIAAFGGDPVGFLVRDKNREPRLKMSPALCTSNGLIITKFFLLVRITTALRFLQILTHCAARELGQNLDEATIEIREVLEMDAFTAAHQDFSGH